MKPFILLLLTCMLAVPATADYMGTGIEVGGSGISITQVTSAGPTTVPQGTLITPEPTGTLSIATSPAGAVLFIDGVERGVTPATITNLPPGTHAIVLKRDGFLTKEAQVEIRPGETMTYAGTLEPVQTAATAAPTRASAGFEAVLCAGVIILIAVKKR